MSAASNSLICVRHSHLILATAEPDVCCKLQSHIWRTARPVWRCLYSQCLLIFFLFYHLIFFIGTIRRHSMDRKVQVKPYKQHVIPKSSGGLVWFIQSSMEMSHPGQFCCQIKQITFIYLYKSFLWIALHFALKDSFRTEICFTGKITPERRIYWMNHDSWLVVMVLLL